MMFSAQHYNAIAKDIREEFAIHVEKRNYHADHGTRYDRTADTASMSAVVNLAIRFAKRFQDDNEHFDPHRFLDACSPNVDLYPLSELWGNLDG